MTGIASPLNPRIPGRGAYTLENAAIDALAATADTQIAAVAAAYATLQAALAALSPTRAAIAAAGRGDLAELILRQVRDVNTGYVTLMDYPIGCLSLGEVRTIDASKARDTVSILPSNVTVVASLQPDR